MKGKFQEIDGLQFRIEIKLNKMKFTIKKETMPRNLRQKYRIQFYGL